MSKKIFVYLSALVLVFALLPTAKAEFSRLSEVIAVGNTLTLDLGGNAPWTLAGLNNPKALSATLENNRLVLKGLNQGIATAYACPLANANLSNCTYVTVTVIPRNVLGINSSESPYKPHPIGTWVNVGKTVYYVHFLGLIPVPTYPIFQSVAPAGVKLVPANDYDLQLPLLPLMQLNDGRAK